MAASRMRRSVARSSAVCSAPPSQRSFLYPRYSASCTASAIPQHRKRFMPDQGGHQMNDEGNVTTLPAPKPDALKSTEVSPPPQTGSLRISWWLPAIAAAVIALVVFFGIRSRVVAENNVANATREAAMPVVRVVHPSANEAAKEIALPGNTVAYIDAPIYARTNGYLRHWYFDIGARVKKGQLLAVIETPEIDQQLQQSRSDL